MDERLRTACSIAALTTALLAIGCGGQDQSAGSSTPPAATDAAAADASSGKIEPCKLLTDEQVATVVSQAQGMVMSAGPSIAAGIDEYQCSWVNSDTHLLIVVVHVAADSASFASLHHDADRAADAKSVSVGDNAWAQNEGSDDAKVVAVKGRSLITVHLRMPGASAKSDALVELARAVAGKV